MLEIDDKLISLDIFEKKFICDLNACKGACCVKGDAGAPLTREEIQEISDNLNFIKPYMTQKGLDTISKNGIYYLDQENTPVTMLIDKKECAFTYFDEDGTAKCSIEKSFLNGESTFHKPISCYLYPIRVKELKYYHSINYDKWDICEPACVCGEKLNVPVFKFLKNPLIKAFGEEFYTKLEIAYREFILKQ